MSDLESDDTMSPRGPPLSAPLVPDVGTPKSAKSARFEDNAFFGSNFRIPTSNTTRRLRKFDGLKVFNLKYPCVYILCSVILKSM